jgi:hypothetical protein
MATFVGVILVCRECGKEFKVPQCRKETAKYCSTKCADGHRAESRRVIQVEKECLLCGRKFHDHPCHSERRKYCSYECANKEFERRCSGVETTFYGKAFWKEMRNLVLERDGHRCQKCGADRLLHVHHLRERRNGGDDSKENLLSLCHPCHRKEHKSYAYLRAEVAATA